MFKRLQEHFHVLLDTDPVQAIREARDLPSYIDNICLDSLRASTLIDAGASVSDKTAIVDGLAFYKLYAEQCPENAIIFYNIGNGLIALADQEEYIDAHWYVATAQIRQEARTYLRQAANVEDTMPDVSSQALTNFGNALWRAHRWVEAYDAYIKALGYDKTNAVAATGAARILLQCINFRMGDTEVLRSVAAKHLEGAKQYKERIIELAGRRAFNDLSKLFDNQTEGGVFPDLEDAGEYERFVANNRLALSPTIEGLDLSLVRWDSLRIQTLTEEKENGPGVPPLFAMYNIIKSDFLAARYLAYQAISQLTPESGYYSDTLDYAVYGIMPSRLILAQRACIDILDKIAVATTEYFELHDNPRTISFRSRWFLRKKKDEAIVWNPQLYECIQKGNAAIIALGELSLDVGEGGALSEMQEYRNSSTHRFTVLHDLGCEPSRKSVYIEHYAVEQFQANLIESMQLTRAAILYFVEMISAGDAIKQKEIGGILGPIIVPSHHWIRDGEEEGD